MTVPEEGLISLDTALLQEYDLAWGEARQRAGSHLVCGPGCSQCCHGLFPITALDAWRLRRGLDQLARENPEAAAVIRQRAEASWSQVEGEFPGDPGNGFFNTAGRIQTRFLSRFDALPCPVLDPETGTCGLYDARPLSCRSYGPPVQIGNQKLPPCKLCFTEADRQEIERCRVEPDPDDLEGAVLAWFRNPTGETLISAALALPRKVCARSEDPANSTEPF